MLYPGSTDVSLIVAVTLGVALPILLAVLVIVICLRRESLRRAKEKKKQRPPSTIELGGGGENIVAFQGTGVFKKTCLPGERTNMAQPFSPSGGLFHDMYYYKLLKTTNSRKTKA